MNYPHNIFWSDIPKDAKIYDLGQSWVVHMPDGRKGLVYWTGQDAAKAQNMLKLRALPKEKLPGPSPDLPNFRNTVKDTDNAKIKEYAKKHAPKPPKDCPNCAGDTEWTITGEKAKCYHCGHEFGV